MNRFLIARLSAAASTVLFMFGVNYLLARMADAMGHTGPVGKTVWVVIVMAAWMTLVLTAHWNFQKLVTKREKEHGLDRRTDSQVHGNSIAPAAAGGTVLRSPSGAILAFSGGGTEPFTGRDGPPAFHSAGIVLGETIAYRAWLLVGKYLTSFNGALWVPGEPMHSLHSPERYNEHGVHAFKELREAFNYADTQPAFVIGRVRLWGDVVEHQTGYRAQYAAPLELLHCSLGEERLNVVRSYYSVVDGSSGNVQ